MLQPLTFLLPALFTIFVWWFTTGLVIVVYGRSQRLVNLFFVAATLLLLPALWGVYATRLSAEPASVYVALTCSVVLWGWQTASYYLGFVTGVRSERDFGRIPTRPWQRFKLALQDSIYHELAALTGAAILLALCWNAPNRWALIMYVALWVMHSSAKLNVFFGVRNFRIDFLPPHLHHLDRLLGQNEANWLFPLSVTIAPSVALALFYQAIVPGTSAAQTVGAVAVGTMILLGLLEHILLVLPVPHMLWGWGVRKLPNAADDRQKPPAHNSLLPLSEQAAGD